MRRVRNPEGDAPLPKKRKVDPSHMHLPGEKHYLPKVGVRNTLADVKNKLPTNQVLGKKDCLEKLNGLKGLSYHNENCTKTTTVHREQVSKTDTVTEGLAVKANEALKTKRTSIMTKLTVSKVVKRYVSTTHGAEVKVTQPSAISNGFERPSEVKGLGRPSEVKGLGRPSEVKGLGRPSEVKALGRPSEVKILGRPSEAKVLGRPTETKALVKPPETKNLGQCSDAKRKSSYIPKPYVKTVNPDSKSSGPLTRAQARKSSCTDAEESSIYHSALEDSDSGAGLGLTEKSAVKEAAAKRRESLNKPPPGVLDVDELECHDIMSVHTYAFDVFKYLKNRESLFRIPDYMKHQKGITSSMRAVLVDWLVEIQEGFELYHETLYLGVKLVDTYLSKHILPRSQLQLLGSACMFIASKYEEKIPLSSTDLIDSSNHCFTAEELFSMERRVLLATNYNLGFPLSYVFVRRYIKCCDSNALIRSLGRYILEMSLMDYSLVMASDSKLAASSLYLAHKMANMEPWSETLKYYSGYKAEELYDLVHALNMTLHKKPKNGINKVQAKYSHEAFGEVAKIPLVPLLSTNILATKSHSKGLPRE